MGNIREKSLSTRTAGAAVWAIGGKLFAKLIDFAGLLVLARVLGPPEFGLVAMAMTAVFIVEAILELPLGAALIRVPEPTDAMFETAFTLSLFRGILIAMLLGAASWGMARFYGEPRLVALICVLSIAPIMRGLISPRMILFAKSFNFRPDFALDITGKICSFALASLVAINTGSYWAIAIGSITTPTVMMLLSHIIAPQRIRFRLSEWPVFADMVGWNTLSQLIMAVNWQADKIFLGRYVDPVTLGRYSMSSDLAAIPYQAIAQPLSKPLIAAFSTLDNHQARCAAYCRVSAMLVMLVSPILVCMSMFSELFVHLILGNQWMAAAPILKWVALIAAIGAMTIPANSLAMVMNRTRFITGRMGVEAAIKLPLMAILIPTFGVNGAIFTQAFVSTSCVLFAMWSVSKIISVSIVSQFKSVLRPQIALVLLVVVSLPFVSALESFGNGWSGWLLLGGVIISFYALHIAFIFLLWTISNRPDGVELLIINKLKNPN